MLFAEGDTVAIMHVFALLPRESLSSHVSFESRYGGATFFLLAKLSITWRSVVRDKLILIASTWCTPTTPDLLMDSDPARSTRLTRDAEAMASISSSCASSSK
ncbi:hypothetical protein DIPPA_10735 [Diplonema papillatum]|nr:hypothetical protein DIPPA_10735 [Diplonema papillatum]